MSDVVYTDDLREQLFELWRRELAIRRSQSFIRFRPFDPFVSVSHC
jgi:hypothetical protein